VTGSAPLHFLLPTGVDDPQRPSGGNRYDRRLSDGLTAAGWTVREHPVAGRWPSPDEEARGALCTTLAALPDDAVVLVDGLVASAVPEVLVPAGRRLRYVVLLHMPLGGRGDDASARECAVLTAAAATVTTSQWVRSRLLDAYALDPARVHAAPPGADPAAAAAGSGGGGGLLCVASVTPGKGHDVLVTALARLTDLAWHCTLVGSVARAPGFVADLRRVVDAFGLAGRVELRGPLTGGPLESSYDSADLLVLPSHSESYGMVVTEALAHGLPVVATDVGGVPEALGASPDGRRPGLLVPPGDAAALVAALRRWLQDAALRADLRAAALDRRVRLSGWGETTGCVARVLEQVAA
jgi:glycosyltransferase involved in cell wall biosynthesis